MKRIGGGSEIGHGKSPKNRRRRSQGGGNTGNQGIQRLREILLLCALPVFFLMLVFDAARVEAAANANPRSFISGKDGDQEAPRITDARVCSVTERSYTVEFTVYDNTAVSSVKLPTWYLFGQQKKTLKWIRLGPREGRVSYSIHFSDFGGKEGLYLTDIYAYDAAGNYSTVRLSAVKSHRKYRDQISPSIYNVKVEKNGREGFTVSFDVSDNLRVVYLQISTWREEDYLKTVSWSTLPIGNGHVSKKVKFSRHGGKAGSYVTKIYAYDLAGNEGSQVIRVEKE